MSAESNSLIRLALPPLPTHDLPPLPPIDNPELEKQVFTHSSFHARPRNATSFAVDDADDIMDNEKLEHVGDSLLGAVVTTLLHQLYPNLKHGPATVLKSHLVSNATLSQLSHQYGFPNRLIANRSELYNLKSGEKTRANIFEAYVAGLFYSYLSSAPPRLPTPPRTPSKSGNEEDVTSISSGSKNTYGQAFDHLESWLRPLFIPIAQWTLDHLRNEQIRLDGLASAKNGDADMDDQAVGAMARLNEHCIAKEGGKPEYVGSRAEGDMWSVMCIATLKNGTQLREEATRSTKKAASTVAAWKICQKLKI